VQLVSHTFPLIFRECALFAGEYEDSLTQLINLRVNGSCRDGSHDFGLDAGLLHLKRFSYRRVPNLIVRGLERKGADRLQPHVFRGKLVVDAN
jgi:hypothetical protein